MDPTDNNVPEKRLESKPGHRAAMLSPYLDTLTPDQWTYLEIMVKGLAMATEKGRHYEAVRKTLALEKGGKS